MKASSSQKEEVSSKGLLQKILGIGLAGLYLLPSSALVAASVFPSSSRHRTTLALLKPLSSPASSSPFHSGITTTHGRLARLSSSDQHHTTMSLSAAVQRDTWTIGGSSSTNTKKMTSNEVELSAAEELILSSIVNNMPSSVPTLQRANLEDPSLPINLQHPAVQVEIRPALAEELPLIVQLRAEVFGGAAASNPEWRIDSLKNLLSRRQKGAVCLVATAKYTHSNTKPVLIGSVEYSSHEFTETGISPCLSDEAAPTPKLYMTGVAVASAYRRQGVASSLLQAVDEHAKDINVPYICMFVDSGNPAALSLYSKAGFHLVPYSPLAEAFASAIGLYKGCFAGRQYAFVYKRLSSTNNIRHQPIPSFGVLSSSSAASSSAGVEKSPFSVRVPTMSSSAGGSLLGSQQEPMRPFPARMPELYTYDDEAEEDGEEMNDEEHHLRVLGLVSGGWGEDVAHRWE